MNEIRVQSMYGYKGRRPYVEIRWQDLVAQLSPEEARAHALILLEAAEASEQDGFLFEFVTTELHQDDHGGAALIQEYRRWREAREKT